MLSMDNCCGSAFCGSGKSPVDGNMTFSRQEGEEDGRSTRSPTLRSSTSPPTDKIRPTPSKPRPVGKEGNLPYWPWLRRRRANLRSEEHTSELQSRSDIVCRLLLE